MVARTVEECPMGQHGGNVDDVQMDIPGSDGTMTEMVEQRQMDVDGRLDNQNDGLLVTEKDGSGIVMGEDCGLAKDDGMVEGMVDIMVDLDTWRGWNPPELHGNSHNSEIMCI